MTLRWAVIGTANIAAKAFLPAMRAAGDHAVVVGSRDPGSARAWAEENEVDRTAGYDEAIGADDVDAVYIAVPNDLHVQYAQRAAATGRLVLCEKPIGLDADEVRTLLAAIGDANVWESFVFPFHPQTELVRSLCADELGGAREIISEFHFRIGSSGNIRWEPQHGGGALLDVGCYPIRLARLLFGGEPRSAASSSVAADTGVDVDFASILDFGADQRLILSAGMRRAPSTFTRVIGADAELRISNPFHPRPADSVQLWRDGAMVRTWSPDAATAFEHAVRHIGAVHDGTQAPRHLAREDSLGNAVALDLARDAVR